MNGPRQIQHTLVDLKLSIGLGSNMQPELSFTFSTSLLISVHRLGVPSILVATALTFVDVLGSNLGRNDQAFLKKFESDKSLLQS